MTLGDLNDSSRDQFVALLGAVFENSPWIAERAWPSRPFATLDDLHVAMVSAMNNAEDAEQLALLRAHPDLGSRLRMSATSTAEQASAGLNQLADDDLDRLQRMNTAYRDTFGFPFLLAVKGCTARDILASLEARRHNSPADERAQALRQVARIARFRLEVLIS